MGILELGWVFSVGLLFAVGMAGFCAYVLFSIYRANRFERIVKRILSGMGPGIEFNWSICQRYYQSGLSPLEAAVEMKSWSKYGYNQK